MNCSRCKKVVTQYRSECPCERNIEVLCYECTNWSDLYCEKCNTLMCNECDLHGCKTCEQIEKDCLSCGKVVYKIYTGKCFDCSIEDKYLTMLLKNIKH